MAGYQHAHSDPFALGHRPGGQDLGSREPASHGDAIHHTQPDPHPDLYPFAFADLHPLGYGYLDFYSPAVGTHDHTH